MKKKLELCDGSFTESKSNLSLSKRDLQKTHFTSFGFKRPHEMPRASTSRRVPSPSPPTARDTAHDSFSFSTDQHPTTSRKLHHKKPNLFNADLSHEQVENLRRQSGLSTLSLSPRRPSLAQSGSTATTRPRRGTGLGYTMQADETSYMAEEEEEEAVPWTMVDRMRNWRNDAMTQHLYESAKFWGGKVLGLTGESIVLLRNP